MGKANRTAARAERVRTKRKKMLWGGVIAVLLVAAAVVGLTLYSQRDKYPRIHTSLAADGSLQVPVASLGEGFNYIDYGGPQDLICYIRSDGHIMTAYDTCEECHLQGGVHFMIYGMEIVCNVCGTTRPLGDFGTQYWGGCQPVSIPDAARLDTDDTVIISAAALEYADAMFAAWDAGDMSVTMQRYQA